ncbi:putative transcriptional Coactivator p15 [Trypoxylus dichotomus]
MPKNKPSKKDSSDSDSGPEDRTPVKKSKPNPPPKSTSSRNDDGEPSWDIEYYMADGGDLRPGKKGIMLTMEQWQKFKSIVSDVDEAIKKPGWVQKIDQVAQAGAVPGFRHRQPGAAAVHSNAVSAHSSSGMHEGAFAVLL